MLVGDAKEKPGGRSKSVLQKIGQQNIRGQGLTDNGRNTFSQVIC